MRHSEKGLPQGKVNRKEWQPSAVPGQKDRAAGRTMAYVSVPKDLTKVKNKVAFNLTRRQIICFGAAAAVGIPFYLLARGTIGDSAAVMGMVVLIVPAFLFAMYERDGMPLEKVLMNIYTVKCRRPGIRPYVTENLYEKTQQDPQLSGTGAGKGGKKRGRKG